MGKNKLAQISLSFLGGKFCYLLITYQFRCVQANAKTFKS